MFLQFYFTGICCTCLCSYFSCQFYTATTYQRQCCCLIFSHVNTVKLALKIFCGVLPLLQHLLSSHGYLDREKWYHKCHHYIPPFFKITFIAQRMLLQLQVMDRHICHGFALNKSPLIEVKVVTLCCSGPAVHSTTWHYLRNIDIWHFPINLFSSKQKDEKSMETLTWNWQTEDCTTRQSPWMVVHWNKALQFLSSRV